MYTYIYIYFYYISIHNYKHMTSFLIDSFTSFRDRKAHINALRLKNQSLDEEMDQIRKARGMVTDGETKEAENHGAPAKAYENGRLSDDL